MKVISFITTGQNNVINKIRDQLGEPTEHPKATGPPLWVQILQVKEHMEKYSDCYPDDVYEE